MEPALIALLVIGVPLGVWGAYEGGAYLYGRWKEWQERRDYEAFVRSHYSEKGNGYFSDDTDLLHSDDDDDDAKPLVHSSHVWGGTGDLRNRRRQPAGWEHHKVSEAELVEMEKSIGERRAHLRQEQAMLDRAEMDLQRHRESVQSRGNSLMGMSPSEASTATEVSQHWSFARPPPPPPPQDTPLKLDMDEADFAMLRSHNVRDDTDEEADGNSTRLRMPSAPSDARHESSDDSSWADVHHRQQSDASDLSFNSIKTPSGHKSDSSSYGVRSISSDDGLL